MPEPTELNQALQGRKILSFEPGTTAGWMVTNLELTAEERAAEPDLRVFLTIFVGGRKGSAEANYYSTCALHFKSADGRSGVHVIRDQRDPEMPMSSAHLALGDTRLETPQQERQERETFGSDSFDVVGKLSPPRPSANDITTTHGEKEKQMNFSDETQRKDDAVPVEHQPSAPSPLTTTPEDRPEDLDVAFDDPRLEAAAERDTKRFRETLRRKFDVLQHHLGEAAKTANQIKMLNYGDPS
jgi:hypothetical protein